jgi:hypothetical protein
MPRHDLLEQSAPRAELDQRSRDARLRLQQVERLLAVPSLPRQSLLRRVLHSLRSRAYLRGQIECRSAGQRLAASGEEIPGETGCAADGSSAAPSILWLACSHRSRVPTTRRAAAGIKPWPYVCNRSA